MSKPPIQIDGPHFSRRVLRSRSFLRCLALIAALTTFLLAAYSKFPCLFGVFSALCESPK